MYAQNGPFVIRQEYGFANPVGTLATRFKPSRSLGIAIGKETSETATWMGRIEYFRLNDPNYEKLSYSRIIQPYKKEYFLTFPMKNIQMELEVIGLSVEMQHKLFTRQYAEIKLVGGFGIYRWNFKRGSYRDSLTADIPIGDTSATTKKETVDVFSMTSNSQQDWSGGLYAGVEGAFSFYDPVWFTFSANYKNILGELWPALKIGMENVSGLQMAEYKIGVMIKINPPRLK